MMRGKDVGSQTIVSVMLVCFLLVSCSRNSTDVSQEGPEGPAFASPTSSPVDSGTSDGASVSLIDREVQSDRGYRYRVQVHSFMPFVEPRDPGYVAMGFDITATISNLTPSRATPDEVAIGVGLAYRRDSIPTTPGTYTNKAELMSPDFPCSGLAFGKPLIADVQYCAIYPSVARFTNGLAVGESTDTSSEHFAFFLLREDDESIALDYFAKPDLVNIGVIEGLDDTYTQFMEWP